MKKIIWPAITLILGIVIGFSIPIMDGYMGDNLVIPQTSFKATKNINNLVEANALGSIKIDSASADSMIRNYRNQNDHAWFRRLRTTDGSSLHGFWLPRLIIDDILSQKGANGIRIYLAKRMDVNSSRRIFTLVLLGTKGSENNLFDTDGNTDIVSPGSSIYDHVDPCPQACGSLGGD